jgi:hypothetical protein
MIARRVVPAALLLAAAVAAVLLLVLREGDGGGQTQVSDEVPPVDVELGLSPRTPGFGDMLTATVSATVDRRRVDPDSVRVRQKFTPWEWIVPPRRMRQDSKTTSLVRTTYVLRCVIGPCVPPRATAELEFDPALVSYRVVGDAGREAVRLRWPVLAVHSQLVSGDAERRDSLTTPWKADLVSMPETSYAVSPGLTRGLLFVGALLLALGGVALAYRAIPKREPEPEPEPELEPEPVLPPLELALILLSDQGQEDGEADRRRALELVAEEMEARDELRLARRARAMAWSEVTPTLAETSDLAASVRAQLALLEPEVADEEKEDDAPVA